LNIIQNQAEKYKDAIAALTKLVEEAAAKEPGRVLTIMAAVGH
jgi:hypothetical protein